MNYSYESLIRSVRRVESTEQFDEQPSVSNIRLLDVNCAFSSVTVTSRRDEGLILLINITTKVVSEVTGVAQHLAYMRGDDKVRTKLWYKPRDLRYTRRC